MTALVFAKPPANAKEAEAICGTLSQPSKMPCPAYSIPATACKFGSALHKIKGTTCAKCYARKGRYVMKNVKQAMQKRLDSLYHPYWVDALVVLIEKSKSSWFRWHDSGDLQSLTHLLNIVEVARRLPHVWFWLPTREVGHVREYETAFGSFPSNLCVRVSAAKVDGPPPRGFATTSTVVTSGATCPSKQQDNMCGSCRQCWDPTISNVSYEEH